MRSQLSQQPLTRGFVDRLGGPRGSHARGPVQSWWTPLRIILAVAWTFLAAGFLSKANCAVGKPGPGGTSVLNWDGNRQYTSACYNDIIPLYAGRGLDEPGFPYAYSWVEDGLTRYMEYPVLTGMFQGLMGFIARHTYGLVSWAGMPESGWYFALTALVLSCFWVGTLILVTRLLGNRTWDALLLAASPLIVVHAFTNWDIPAVFCAVAALYAASRGRTGWAGVWIGLGTAVKLWPLFLLGAFFVIAWRNRRWKQFGILAGTAIGSWLAVNLPICLAYPEAWGEFYRLNQTRGAEWTTIYALLQRVFGFTFSPEFLNTFSLLAFLGLCAAIASFGVRLRRSPHLVELIVLILVAFLLFNKVWSPQYSLWLVVPVVLALPRWRLLVCWMLADAAVWPILMWHMLGTDNLGLPHEFLDVAVLVRDGFIIAIAVLVIRQMRGKGQDLLAGPDRLLGKFAA